MPAYEWNFGDVNPPVHAWALRTVYEIEKESRGEGDLAFLKDGFHKLMLNFTWWINRKPRDIIGDCVFKRAAAAVPYLECLVANIATLTDKRG